MAFRVAPFLVAALAVAAASCSEATGVVAASACPRELSVALEGLACRPHHGRDAVSAMAPALDEACAESLRELLPTLVASSLPCVATRTALFPADVRQLEAAPANSSVNTTSTFTSGNFTCTMDVVSATNTTNTSYVVRDCVQTPHNYLWLWICLGVFGGLYALWCFVFWGLVCAEKPCVVKFCERRRERASAKAAAEAAREAEKAAEKAAKKLAKKLAESTGGHPYTLA